MGLLLPVAKVNSSVVNQFVHRVVDCTIDGFVLFATSDSNTGTITQVKVWNNLSHKLELTQSCSGYACSVYVGGLPSGDYVAKVFTTNTTLTYEFTL
jgi:hypothetical protein